MKLLEPIQVYEGDGINPRWLYYFYGDGGSSIFSSFENGDGKGEDLISVDGVIRRYDNQVGVSGNGRGFDLHNGNDEGSGSGVGEMFLHVLHEGGGDGVGSGFGESLSNPGLQR